MTSVCRQNDDKCYGENLVMDEVRNNIELSDKFWESVNELEYLTVDQVNDLIIQNSKALVVLPENMILRQLKALNKTEQADAKKHLLPARHPDASFFIADGVELPIFRDDMASMENPLFALRPADMRTIVYEHNNVKTIIRPTTEIGRATIFDKAIWIYCISKLMQAKYENASIDRKIRFSIFDFLKQTNRNFGGSAYDQFKLSLSRLKGTTIETEIVTGKTSKVDMFGLLDQAHMALDENGNVEYVEVVLPDWLYRSIEHNEVLSIDPSYFRLRKPIDRRIYEIARKHCSSKFSWAISLEKLHKKTGTTDAIRNFRVAINSLSKSDALPGYKLMFDRDSDMVTFYNRQMKLKGLAEELKIGLLD